MYLNFDLICICTCICTRADLALRVSESNPETWGDYSGYTNWRDGVTPARGISSERQLIMKGPSSSGVQTLGKWVVWNGNEKKGFVCQFKKKGKVENVLHLSTFNTLL